MSVNISLPKPQQEYCEVKAQLENAHATPEIILCKQLTTSTNDDALQLYQQGYRSALVIGQQQDAGRGQHQRTWQSPLGNIYISILLELARPLDGRFALECGLNIIHCSFFNNSEQLQIKWANDLYSTLGKWGGILIEPIHSTQVIVGIGINVVPIHNKQDIPQAVTSLSELGIHIENRTQLIAELYLAILNAGHWFNHNSLNLATRFNRVAAFKDQWVNIHRQHQDHFSGYFRGIQDDGAILIQSNADLTPMICYDGRLIIPE